VIDGVDRCDKPDAVRAWSIVPSLLCAVLIGCGKPSAVPARPTSPFTEADTKLFDDGVDLVSDPEGLAGKWADDWNLDMRERVRRSDLIAVVTVETLRSDIDPEGRTTHRLLVEVGRVMKGKQPGDELDLASADAATGYATIDTNKGRLLHMELLALIKWVAEPDGTVSSHFHLASASENVLSRVHAHIERDRPQNRTVIERRYDSSKGEE
jgi:hypothetical protein